MYENIFSRIRLRYDELLAGAETAQLLERSKVQLMSRADQVDALAKHQSAESTAYILARGQGEVVLKIPHTDALLAAAKKDDLDAEVLGEVFFFNRSVF